MRVSLVVSSLAGLAGLVGLVGVVGILGACTSTPRGPQPEPTLESGSVDDFAKVRPVRVVVQPVEVQADAPADALRLAFYRSLIDRRYAPFRLDLLPGDLPADPAIGSLVVRIGQWNRDRALADRVIVAGGSAELVVGGRAIWNATFANLRLRCHVAEHTSMKRRDAVATRVLAARILRTLPVKND